MIKRALCGITLSLISGLGYAQWCNWAGNQISYPIVSVSPQTKDELIAVIKQAVCDNHTIRAVGVGHSFSALACPESCCISMKQFNRILSVDTDLKRVCVEGGILLKDFNQQIDQYGLALSNIPAMGDMTLAGALCTASHGSGHTGTLSDYILEIELITADGMIHHLSPKDDLDAFKAAAVSLGALGIIYSVTLQCESAFTLSYRENRMHIDALIACYKEIFQKSDYSQFRWQLGSDTVCVDVWSRDVANHAISGDQSTRKDSYQALQWYTGIEIGLSSEIAIPFDLLPQAISFLQTIYAVRSQNEAIVVEVNGRFVKADKNAFLSPAIDYDVVYINLGTDTDEKYYALFKEFEETMYVLRGRPHWGKINSLDHIKAYALYGGHLMKFIEVKKRLDPNNIFSNYALNTILYPS